MASKDVEADPRRGVIHARHRSSEESRQLEEIPGVGPIVATALAAEVGDWKKFTSGPQSVWLRGSAWCPDSIRPGAKGDLAQSRSKAIDICAGCSSPAPWLSSEMRAHGTKRLWLARLMDRRPIKIAAIALANKIARMALGHDGEEAEVVAGGVAVGRQKSRRIGEGTTT
jgi:transposase